MIYLTQLPQPQPGQNQKQLLHKTAWALLSHALGDSSPRPSWAGSLRFGPHGKPYLEGGPSFSIAHTKGLALCALEDWNTGIDAERPRAFSPQLQSRVFTPSEQSLAVAAPSPDALFTTLWTLKESYMKYTGLGLAQGAATLSFHFEDGQPVLQGSPLSFRTAIWQGFHISQCGPAPFALTLVPISFDQLRL